MQSDITFQGVFGTFCLWVLGPLDMELRLKERTEASFIIRIII